MLTDPETLAQLQELNSLKFIPMAEYTEIKNEINIYSDINLGYAKQSLETKTKDLERLQAELEVLKQEYETKYDALSADTDLGLDKWCGTCKWSGGKDTCDMRKDYFVGTYGHNEISAKVAVMKQSPKCKGE